MLKGLITNAFGKILARVDNTSSGKQYRDISGTLFAQEDSRGTTTRSGQLISRQRGGFAAAIASFKQGFMDGRTQSQADAYTQRGREINAEQVRESRINSGFFTPNEPIGQSSRREMMPPTKRPGYACPQCGNPACVMTREH